MGVKFTSGTYIGKTLGGKQKPRKSGWVTITNAIPFRAKRAKGTRLLINSYSASTGEHFPRFHSPAGVTHFSNSRVRVGDISKRMKMPKGLGSHVTAFGRGREATILRLTPGGAPGKHKPTYKLQTSQGGPRHFSTLVHAKQAAAKFILRGTGPSKHVLRSSGLVRVKAHTARGKHGKTSRVKAHSRKRSHR